MFESISTHWRKVQKFLFPRFEDEGLSLSKHHQELIAVLEFARLEEHIGGYIIGAGRPAHDRISLAAAFIAKAVYNLPTTVLLIEVLHNDATLRRICGWERKSDIPSESTFSRAFAEFASSNIISCVHRKFVERLYKGKLVMHISRDSTAIEAREKGLKKPKALPTPPKKRGRPKKGEVRVKELTRLQKQVSMSVNAMLADLPKACDSGSKVNSKGFPVSWNGYKLHIDTADGDIPVSVILTSASVHDSQVALPLSRLSERALETHLYELMDSAYDADVIRTDVFQRGKVALIDWNRRYSGRCFEDFEQIRYHHRSSSERVNSQLKDNFGGHFIRVKGHAKVQLHLMFGVLVLTVTQALALGCST